MNDHSKILLDSTPIKYKIVCKTGFGREKVLTVAESRVLAENYVLGLSKRRQKKCKIVPVTEDNKELLLG